MRIYTEVALKNFEFWGGAKSRAAKLTESEFEVVESILEDCFPRGIERNRH